MAAGGLAGLCQIVITTPMELLKIQMQDAGRTAGMQSFVVAYGGVEYLNKVRQVYYCKCRQCTVEYPSWDIFDIFPGLKNM